MSNANILVVDDEPQNLAVIRQILSPEYHLYFARNGQQALEMTERHKPQLVLLDVQMPGVDGYQVCETLKANPESEHIPVIFITGLQDSIDEARGLNAGAVDYVTKPVSPAVLRARVKTHLSLTNVSSLENSYREAIHMLGEAGHYNDNDTGLHIWRMANYCKVLAEKLEWSDKDCDCLEYAAAMHDTGKIGIPSEILRKPGKLTADEWKIMKTHTELGYHILSQSDAKVFKWASSIALYHHEKWDGSGYPKGLAGEEIPITSRIVAICDVFDALTSKRPYKDPWPLEKTLDVMNNDSGTHFDPTLMQAFMDILPEILRVKDHWDEKEIQLEGMVA